MPSDNTERVGVNAVEKIFLDDFKWVFREQTVSDYGIDAIVESFDDDDKPSGKLIALQIKTGASYFKEKKDNDYVFRGEPRHLEYWTNHALPVFIVLHNPENGMTLWQKIERRLVTETERGWSITIPSGNVLDKDAKKFFEAAMAPDDEAMRRFTFAVDLDMMKVFAEHDEVYLRMDRWINKLLTIRGVHVYFDDKDKNEPDMELALRAAGYSNHECMQRWFPWLDYEYAEPIENHAGEVDSYVYLVTLNDHAKAFMALEEFFQTGEPAQEEPEPQNSHSDGDFDWDEMYGRE